MRRDHTDCQFTHKDNYNYKTAKSATHSKCNAIPVIRPDKKYMHTESLYKY